MATTPGVADVAERCSDCDRDTPHSVAVHILTESTAEKNAAFSREPYRVSTCRACGATSRTRMNDA